jgi:phage FluMu protein Com
MPTGLYHIKAEEVALSILRKNFNILFNIELSRIDATYLDIFDPHCKGINKFTINNENIFNVLHKELNHDKDCNGSDAILILCKNVSQLSISNKELQLADIPIYSVSEETQIDYKMKKELSTESALDSLAETKNVFAKKDRIALKRFQLKLGQGTFSKEQVSKIKQDMENRGRSVTNKLKEKFDIVSYQNYLVTTKHVEKKDMCAEDNLKNNADFDKPVFICLSNQHLSKIWPIPVKALGAPYSSNKNKYKKTLEIDFADNLVVESKQMQNKILENNKK